ncbi:hypothetical protein P3T40_003555 [Paraburkholderia sp. EB58]|uniref:baseplate hub protein n=1 Tax=Paraburkholderia sp. EB58 TaxID=3035125 RepID=UPI003D24F097
MPLKQRVLRADITLPNAAGSSITLDQSLDIKVKLSKAVFMNQQICEIVVTNLSASLRESLLSQITAFNRRNVETGVVTAGLYASVSVTAGYIQPGTPPQMLTTTIFTGQIVRCDPVGELPNLAMKLTCYSQQLIKTQFMTQPPGSATFGGYCQWVADQLGLSLYLNTSKAGQKVTNPGAANQSMGQLLPELQRFYYPNVVAWIDNNTLYVSDANKVVAQNGTVAVNEFVNGFPVWTDYGVTFGCLFNPSIFVGSACILKSTMNPSLNNVGYVVTMIEYDLTSRQDAFDMRIQAAPPA